MKCKWMTTLAIVGGLGATAFAQQYPQQPYPQQPGYQGDPNYDPYYDDGQYSGDPNYDPYYRDPGMSVPTPPPAPAYAYARPPMPGPGYYWVGGYWNWVGGRYSWIGGYWALPPYAGGYWVAPRYVSGRYFLGYWGGGARYFNRGTYSYGPRRTAVAPRGGFRGSLARGSNGVRGGSNRR